MIWLYTDGACSYNPGPGGWAYAVVHDDIIVHQDAKGDPATTNNRMELFAILKGLSYLHQNGNENTSITVCTDSAYCLNSLQTWCHNWKKNGWKRPKNKPIENLSLIQELYSLIYDSSWSITFKKVKAHQPSNSPDYDKYNDLVDNLATTESKKIQGTSY
ncbi:ribonuclease HI [Priestia megaterium]|nr:ribonuclease HI [Priestia megaterium]